jgi:hypothetical protein
MVVCGEDLVDMSGEASLEAVPSLSPIKMQNIDRKHEESMESRTITTSPWVLTYF